MLHNPRIALTPIQQSDLRRRGPSSRCASSANPASNAYFPSQLKDESKSPEELAKISRVLDELRERLAAQAESHPRALPTEEFASVWRSAATREVPYWLQVASPAIGMITGVGGMIIALVK